VSSALSSVKSCADVESLTNLVSMPQDKAVQARIEAIRGKVNEARALWAAGKYDKGIDVAKQASDQTEGLPYPPVRAEALWVQGKLLNQVSKLEDARLALEKSIEAADSGRADEDRAKAMVEFVTNYTSEKDYRSAARWGAFAQGAVNRLAKRDEIQVDLLLNMGRMHFLAGNYDETVKSYERALALLDQDKSTDGYRRGKALDGLGVVYIRSPKLRNPTKAIEKEKESIKTYEAALGPRHPALFHPHNNIISAYLQLDDLEEADKHADIAYEIGKAAYGEFGTKTLDVLDFQSSIRFRKKQYGDALRVAQTALAAREQQGMPESARPWALLNAGRALVELNRAAEAVPLLERAFKVFDATKGSDLEDVGDACFFLARAVRDRDSARAAELAARAKDSYLAMGLKGKAEGVTRWLDASGLKRKAGR
jgi:serine/threonine-protein kinase